jgi:hypothetical protein
MNYIWLSQVHVTLYAILALLCHGAVLLVSVGACCARLLILVGQCD